MPGGVPHTHPYTRWNFGAPSSLCDGIVPISLLFVALVGLVACIAATISFTSMFFPLQSNTESFVDRFADSAVESTSFLITRHYDRVRREALLAQRVAQELYKPYPESIDLTARWFARAAEKRSEFISILDGLDRGASVGPYGPFAPDRFPRKEGCFVVSNTSSQSAILTNGYFRLDTFEPDNKTHPVVPTTVAFNFSARSYAAQFRSQLGWTDVAPGAVILTSVFALGGPFVSLHDLGDTAAFPAPGTFAVYDYTTDVVKYFNTLTISRTGAAVLIDVKSHAFLGGNIADVSVIVNSSGSLLLTLLEDLVDPRIAPVVAAGAALGGAGGNALLTCKAPCSMVFRPESGTLVERSAHRFSLLNPFSSVRVVEIVDEYGLDLRLMLVLPSDDFCGDMRRGATLGLIIPACLIAAILVIVFVVVDRVLVPLRDMERLLLSVVEEHGGIATSPSTPPPLPADQVDDLDRPPASDGSSSQQRVPWGGQQHLIPQRSRLEEIQVIQAAWSKLMSEMAVIRSFLGHPNLGVEACNDSNSGFPSLSVSGPRADSLVVVSEAPSDLAGACSESMPLYAMGSLWRVPVTTVVVNLANFEDARRALLPSLLVSMQAKYLAVIQRLAGLHGGVVALMYGDHLWVHFNAANRVVFHAAAASRMMLAAEAEIRAANLECFSGVHFGASTANALCGVMGTSNVKVFTVVGENVQQASSLAWQAKQEDQGILMCWRTAKLLVKSKDVAAQNVRLAILPYERNRITAVARPILVQGMRDKYFPHAASDADAREILAICNEASDCYAALNCTRSVELYQMVNRVHLEGDWLAHLVFNGKTITAESR